GVAIETKRPHRRDLSRPAQAKAQGPQRGGTAQACAGARGALEIVSSVEFLVPRFVFRVERWNEFTKPETRNPKLETRTPPLSVIPRPPRVRILGTGFNRGPV